MNSCFCKTVYYNNIRMGDGEKAEFNVRHTYGIIHTHQHPFDIHIYTSSQQQIHTHTHTPSGSNRCEGSREKASLPFFLPGRAVNGNGIPIPWSLLLIHNRPTAGLLGTSADMPANAHTCTRTHRGTNTCAHSPTHTHDLTHTHQRMHTHMPATQYVQHACTSVVSHTSVDGSAHTHQIHTHTQKRTNHTHNQDLECSAWL